MCRLRVRVVVLPDGELEVPWVAAIGEDGVRVLLVRESTPPADVCVGYAEALSECPVRVQLDALRPVAVA